MKLLKQLNAVKLQPIAEDAAAGATGGGAIAGTRLPLFSTLVKRTKPASTIPEDNEQLTLKKSKKGLKLGEAFRRLSEDMNDGADDPAASRQAAIDSADTIARLKSLETKDSAEKRDVVVFGLEDDNGGVVRVSIKPDQAKEFEQALQNFVNDQENDDDTPEIAEILFSMRDHFDIIDVEWPDVQEDEEQVDDIAGDPGAEGMDPNDPNAMPPEDVAPPAPDTGEVTSLLQNVIDMMKADAAARYADAKAREEEAKMRQATAIVKQAENRVKKEEQFLDMEAAQKAEKEEQRETKRLASLAKWKRDVERDTGVPDFDDDELDPMSDQGDGGQDAMGGVAVAGGAAVAGGREEEEVQRTRSRGMPTQRVPVKPHTGRPRVAPRDIASFILKRVQ